MKMVFFDIDTQIEQMCPCGQAAKAGSGFD
jgi:hypothetical protein